MTGSDLHTTLLAAGASLALDAQGKLHLTPPAVAQPYRAAIQAHLPYLLVCAAVAEAQRLLHAQQIQLTAVRPMVRIDTLNAACQAGDVDATRAAAVQYVAAWRAWLEGDPACPHP